MRNSNRAKLGFAIVAFFAIIFLSTIKTQPVMAYFDACKVYSEACGDGYYLSICSRTIGGPLLCSDCGSVISECPGN